MNLSPFLLRSFLDTTIYKTRTRTEPDIRLCAPCSLDSKKRTNTKSDRNNVQYILYIRVYTNCSNVWNTNYVIRIGRTKDTREKCICNFKHLWIHFVSFLFITGCFRRIAAFRTIGRAISATWLCMIRTHFKSKTWQILCARCHVKNWVIFIFSLDFTPKCQSETMTFSMQAD